MPGFSTDADHAAIKERMKDAAKLATFVVPLGVVYETGDHIADVSDRDVRIRLAQLWASAVRQALEMDPHRWFDVHPAVERGELVAFVCGWENELAGRSRQRKEKGDIGLTDWGSVAVARALRAEYPRLDVHIWTKDRDLKRREPCSEAEPFLGS